MISGNNIIDNKNLSVSSMNTNIYSKSLITRKIQLEISNIGDNIVEVIKQLVVQQLEGKCIIEGYVREGSVKIKNYSSGELFGDKVLFDIVIECEICCPVEGMEIQCIAKNITKAGIRAELNNKNEKSPVVVFLARDHHNSDNFVNVKVDDVINIRIIGQRYELNDKYVSVIAELI